MFMARNLWGLMCEWKNEPNELWSPGGNSAMESDLLSSATRLMARVTSTCATPVTWPSLPPTALKCNSYRPNSCLVNNNQEPQPHVGSFPYCSCCCALCMFFFFSAECCNCSCFWCMGQKKWNGFLLLAMLQLSFAALCPLRLSHV